MRTFIFDGEECEIKEVKKEDTFYAPYRVTDESEAECKARGFGSNHTYVDGLQVNFGNTVIRMTYEEARDLAYHLSGMAKGN